MREIVSLVCSVIHFFPSAFCHFSFSIVFFIIVCGPTFCRCYSVSLVPTEAHSRSRDRLLSTVLDQQARSSLASFDISDDVVDDNDG